MSESIRRWKLIFRSAALIQRNLLLLESIICTSPSVFWGFFLERSSFDRISIAAYINLNDPLIPSSLAHPSCSSFHKMIDIPKDRSIEIRALRSISLFFEKKYNRYGFFV